MTWNELKDFLNTKNFDGSQKVLIYDYHTGDEFNCELLELSVQGSRDGELALAINFNNQ
jgi:hypothetical protein